MSDQRRVRTPLRRRLQLFRVRMLPILIWLGAVWLVASLWTGRATRLDAPAMVDAARRATLAPVDRGTLVNILVGISDRVTQGQLLARMDDRAVQTAIAVAEAELERLKAEVRAAERRLKEDMAQREVDLFSRSRNYAMRIERLRLEKLDHLIELENDQVDLQRLAVNLGRDKELRERAIIPQQEYDDLRFRHEALQKKVKASQEAIAVIDKEMKEAEGLRVTPPASPAADTLEVVLSPLREALQVQLRRVAEIEQQRRALELRSPLEGIVTMVHRYEGDTLLAGDPVVTVADPQSAYIVSYIEPGSSIEPAPGTPVEVRRRTSAIHVEVARTCVAEVGTQVEQIPREFLRNAPVRRYGFRVLIKMPESMSPVLGGGTDLRGRSPSAAEAPAPRLGEALVVRYFLPSRVTRWLDGPGETRPPM